MKLQVQLQFSVYSHYILIKIFLFLYYNHTISLCFIKFQKLFFMPINKLYWISSNNWQKWDLKHFILQHLHIWPSNSFLMHNQSQWASATKIINFYLTLQQLAVNYFYLYILKKMAHSNCFVDMKTYNRLISSCSLYLPLNSFLGLMQSSYIRW